MADLFPLSVLNCESPDAVNDPRFDFACSSSATVSVATQVVHLIVIAAVVFGTALLFAIYQRICTRRIDMALLATPAVTSAQAGGRVGARLAKQVADACVASASTAHPALLATLLQVQDGTYPGELQALCLQMARDVMWAARPLLAAAGRDVGDVSALADDAVVGAPPALVEAFTAATAAAARGAPLDRHAFEKTAAVMVALLGYVRRRRALRGANGAAPRGVQATQQDAVAAGGGGSARPTSVRFADGTREGQQSHRPGFGSDAGGGLFAAAAGGEAAAATMASAHHAGSAAQAAVG